MTITQSLLSFVLAAGLLTLTPGLDTALVLRVAATKGPSRAAQAGFGIVVGTLVWGGIVAVGLGALLTASAVAFAGLKWVGVAYLCWLGLLLILRPRTTSPMDAGLPVAQADIRASSFWTGLLQNLLNPKVGVFYISFLPQFVPSSVSPAPYMMLLAAIHGAMGSAWFIALILATRPIMRSLRRPGVLAIMDRVTGAVFIVFGAKLALARR